MKNLSILLAGALVVSVSYAATRNQTPTKQGGQSDVALREGDVLFQVTLGGQSEAISLATGSKWTHVGILFKDGRDWMVLEAVGPVKSTPLKEWIGHGTGGHYTAKRWVKADAELDQSAIAKLRKTSERYMGLQYDWEFRWSDERIYCSELVWKLYKEALGVALCEPKPMRDHALGSAVVQRTMKERYGSTPPLEELMIAPGALFDCEQLVTVIEK